MDGKHVTGEVEEKVCAHCGGTYHGNFCIHCGTKAEEMTFCPVCGLDREEGAAFCHNCGYSYMQEAKKPEEETPDPVVETPKAEPKKPTFNFPRAEEQPKSTPKFSFSHGGMHAPSKATTDNLHLAPQQIYDGQSVASTAPQEEQKPKASRLGGIKNLLCSWLGNLNLVFIVLVIEKYLSSYPFISVVLTLAQFAAITMLFIAFWIRVIAARYMFSEAFEKKLRLSQLVLLPILVLVGVSSFLPSRQAGYVLLPLALGGFIRATYIRKKREK